MLLYAETGSKPHRQAFAYTMAKFFHCCAVKPLNEVLQSMFVGNHHIIGHTHAVEAPIEFSM